MLWMWTALKAEGCDGRSTLSGRAAGGALVGVPHPEPQAEHDTKKQLVVCPPLHAYVSCLYMLHKSSRAPFRGVTET
jgi:hypothetical protein